MSDPSSAEDLLGRFIVSRAHLLGYLKVMTRDHHAAEEALQETYLVVQRKLSEYDATRDFDAWVRGIARHVAARIRIRYRPLGGTLEQLDQAVDLAFEEVEPGDEANPDLEHLSHCLDRLPSEHRQLLALRYRDGLSMDGISAQTGRTCGAIQVMLSRLRQGLLECIQHFRCQVMGSSSRP